MNRPYPDLTFADELRLEIEDGADPRNAIKKAAMRIGRAECERLHRLARSGRQPREEIISEDLRVGGAQVAEMIETARDRSMAHDMPENVGELVKRAMFDRRMELGSSLTERRQA